MRGFKNRIRKNFKNKIDAGEKNMSTREETYYLVSKDYSEIIKTLSSNELANLLNVKRESLSYKLVKIKDFNGFPIAQE